MDRTTSLIVAQLLGIVAMQEKYVSLTRTEKLSFIRDTVNKHKNDQTLIDIMRKIRNGSTRKSFGEDMLVDTAYAMFP